MILHTDAAMLAIQLERAERRVEAIGSNPFIESKDADRLMREMRMEMKEAIRKYNNLEFD